MFYFAEYPRVTYCSATAHKAIYSVAIFIFKRFLRTIYISVTKNGYTCSWVVFILSYQRPIGFTFIHLGTGTAVYSQCLDANILQTLCYFFYILRIIIPA